MIGCDWLNTPEEMLLQSADDGLCVCRLLIMGRACGSIYFIFMSQMVGAVLFMNKLDVQKQRRDRDAPQDVGRWRTETQRLKSGFALFH